MVVNSDIAVAAEDPSVPPSKAPRGRWLPFRSWDWRYFLFYLGIPAVVATYAALNNWTILQLSGYQTTLAFYAGHAFVPWWTSAIVTYLCMRLLKPWQPPQLVILAVGSFFACLIVLPYSNWLTEYFAVGWVSGDSDGTLSSAHIYNQFGFWTFTARASVIWILANVAFDRFLGLPRYRYVAAAPAPIVPALASADLSVAATPAAARVGAAFAPEARQPSHEEALRFLQRLPATVSPDEVIALKAEQHYIKVYTSDRSFMTLFRFSDAVAEMDPSAGQQVHRSYWVRSSAIRAVRREGGKYSVELVSGLLAPISEANRGLIRELAKARNIPILPPL
ncbi:MAG: LytTR family DNA-binding domain-containing protein [Gammaproteobacteria bacterium]